MKIKTFLLLIVIGFFNCTQTPIGKQNALKGNCKTEDFRNKHAYIFTFEDSLCSYLYPWGEYSKYWVNDDTLNIKKEKITYKFLIPKLLNMSNYIDYQFMRNI